MSEVYLREFRPGGPIGVEMPEVAPVVTPWLVRGPNPSWGAVAFRAPASEPIEIRDVAGRLLGRLPAGVERWEGVDDAGHPVPAGVYFLRGNRHFSRRARGATAMSGVRGAWRWLCVGVGVFAAGCGDDEVLDVEYETRRRRPRSSPSTRSARPWPASSSRRARSWRTPWRSEKRRRALPSFPAGREGLVVSSRSNRVDVVDLDALAVRRSIDIGPGSNPYGVAVAGGDAAYVSCFLSDEVVRLDIAGGTVAKRIPVGRGPEGVLYLEDHGDVYVALTGYTNIGVYGEGAVEVIAAAADTVRTRLVVGKNPQNLGRAPDGTVHVACTGNYGIEEGRVFVIDAAVPAVVDSIPIGGSPVAVLMLSGDRGLTAGYAGGLKRYDPATRIAEEMASLAGDTWFTALVYDEADSLLYVSDFDDSMVHVVDPWADVHVRSFRVGHGPVALALRR